MFYKTGAALIEARERSRMQALQSARLWCVSAVSRSLQPSTHRKYSRSSGEINKLIADLTSSSNHRDLPLAVQT